MKTFRYILTIVLVSLVLSSSAEEEKKPPRVERHLHNTGLRIGADITAPFQGAWTKGDRIGAEFNIDAEIKPDIFLVGEAGWEDFDIEQDYVDYSSSGAFLRLGADYNMLHTAGEPNDKSTLFIGLRYGFSASNQTVNEYTIGNYWGSTSSSFPKQNYTSHWGEVVLGMKAEVLKNFYMGWDIRVKFMVHQKDLGIPDPYFTAGYGTNDSSAIFDFSYNLSYSIPFKKKEKPTE